MQSLVDKRPSIPATEWPIPNEEEDSMRARIAIAIDLLQAERRLRRLVKVASKEQQGERHGYGACR